LGVAVPIRHPLLAYQAIPPHALVGYRLVLCDWQECALSRILHPLEDDTHVVELASSQDMMLALVSAGYGDFSQKRFTVFLTTFKFDAFVRLCFNLENFLM